MDYIYRRRAAQKPKIAQYCRLVKKDGTLNVQYIGCPVKYNVSNMYHDIVDKNWPFLIVLITVMYTSCALFFATLYWIDGGVLKSYTSPSDQELTFPEAYYFSVQTQDTIGYGALYPGDQVTTNLISALQSWLSMLVYATITGIVFTKLSRPSKIKNNIMFSSNAVINNTSSLTFVPNARGGDETEGEYRSGEEPCLVFRIANVRKAQLCAASFTLLCVSYKPNEHGEQYTTQELNFEINQQVGRVRGMNFSVPQLNLPWNVVHPIDRSSPLYGLTAKEVIRNRIEIIAVLDAIDEACADNFQARSSYTANDIHWQAEFADMVACVSKNKVSEHIKAVRQQSLLRRRSETSVEKARRTSKGSSPTCAPPNGSIGGESSLGLRKLINDNTVISKAQPVSPMIKQNRRYSGGGIHVMPRLGVMPGNGTTSKVHLGVISKVLNTGVGVADTANEPAHKLQTQTGTKQTDSVGNRPQNLSPDAAYKLAVNIVDETSPYSQRTTSRDTTAGIPDGETLPLIAATSIEVLSRDNASDVSSAGSSSATHGMIVGLQRRGLVEPKLRHVSSLTSVNEDAIVDMFDHTDTGHRERSPEDVVDEAMFVAFDGILVANFSLFDTVLPLPSSEDVDS
ncbi:hypothetical protein SARC_04519 [Sphaeroforma arctica JP610]|uniref:Inward rectifier potassium channel C-terminal domain-containing protein n=1 Tax=Sphaeroforma arctica JP610 TaxID=667725 RepID=A0A0L0G2C2_9EUKA|nr:hypothetical protein, variant [Sphaeroforma arctica JP610]XP_014157122.1 hypothetical protein SARC_04519 [Sphaeroforma arctica JP610]KNC83219.1 hypothetical protein, variant [Sphaeroforma arctica JP610]KNC83220.1 hypothetical protein SARC_04519 [Sphaeroforma arctica JP610]|eukprot:XP_014157121.1 hypothetical protein, variant [Sphaeroforma arctica JP610]